MHHKFHLHFFKHLIRIKDFRFHCDVLMFSGYSDITIHIITNNLKWKSGCSYTILMGLTKLFSYVCRKLLKYSCRQHSCDAEHQVVISGEYSRKMAAALTLSFALTSSSPHSVHGQHPSAWPLTLERWQGWCPVAALYSEKDVVDNQWTPVNTSMHDVFAFSLC